jgi:multimeric flavodoxin WrbA
MSSTNRRRDLIRSDDIQIGGNEYALTLEREDLSDLYPGMVRYTLRLISGGNVLSAFRTNTYEYSPTNPLDAEKAARNRADEWKDALKAHPEDFLDSLAIHKPRCLPAMLPTDAVIIQGSPRADGNCSILAGWALKAASDLQKTAQVIYPHDMDIRPCIGCYQCYNTGSCTIEDDMAGVIRAIRECSLLIICSPVYTNTVPGGLKLLIDRCQAYHAERALTGAGHGGQKGLLFSVAGRRGRSNFACVTRVIEPFMKNLEITPSGEILIDGMDELRDVQRVAGLEDRVRKAVRSCIAPSP